MASTFKSVFDYFGLESANMIAASSESGDNRQHTCAYNMTSEATTTETSGIWMNPRVTYQVVGDATLSVSLGKSFAGSNGVSGYMISSVEIDTSVGNPPLVTVSSVANEGVDAIKKYPLSISISARHRPQDLMNAFPANTNLLAAKLTASCDPVVVAENGMPCASDATHGRLIISASVAAYNDEPAPSPTTSSGFVSIGDPASFVGTGYKSWAVNFRKELA